MAQHADQLQGLGSIARPHEEMVASHWPSRKPRNGPWKRFRDAVLATLRASAQGMYTRRQPQLTVP